MVHCHGALDCLESAVQNLRPNGIVMFSDYGTTVARNPSDIIEFQSFGESAAHAVNFHQIDTYFDNRPDIALIRPENEEGSLITRVLFAGKRDNLFELVDLLFGDVRQKALMLPVEAAREMLRVNAFQEARRLYTKAFELQPYNWSLAEEVAEILLLNAGDYEDAGDLAEAALNLNPFSPGLLRILSSVYLHSKDLPAALNAIHKSLSFNQKDTRTHILHTRILIETKDYGEALTAIAKGLGFDTETEYREELIGLQDEILVQISLRSREDLIRQINRIRALDDLPS